MGIIAWIIFGFIIGLVARAHLRPRLSRFALAMANAACDHHRATPRRSRSSSGLRWSSSRNARFPSYPP